MSGVTDYQTRGQQRDHEAETRLAAYLICLPLPAGFHHTVRVRGGVAQLDAAALLTLLDRLAGQVRA